MIALVAARLVSLALFLVPIAVTGPAFPALALVNSVAAYLEFLASFLVDVELVFLALTVVNWSLNEADNRDNECNQLASLRQHSRRLLSSLSSLSEVKSLMIRIHGIFQRWCSLGKGHCKVEG